MANDIETVCKLMVSDGNAQLEKYEKEQAKKGNKAKSMRLFLSRNPSSGVRTPEEQAKEVLAQKSWTCSGSHMSDSARHVGAKIDGKTYTNMSFKKVVTKEDYDKFIDVYDAAMKKQNLCNFTKKPGFLPNSMDPFHVELKNSRLADSDPRVQKCLLIYAKATREGGKKRNEKFEKENPAAKKFLETYDKAKGDFPARSSSDRLA